MELKRASGLYILKSARPFNQTRMELKLGFCKPANSSQFPFNQTRMELKLETDNASYEALGTFNQTRMELKHEYLIFCVGGKVNF